MTVVATTASVKFGTTGVAEVESRLHPTGRTFIDCYTYDDSTPILAIDDRHVKVSLSVPESGRVTDEDVAVARQLAGAVAKYAAELEKLAAANRESAADPSDCVDRVA